ncbi:MAG: helix-turn-helix domain-containing protein [Candidatus Dormibacteria bacterium]
MPGIDTNGREQVHLIATATDTLCHLLWFLRRQEPELVELVQSRGSTGFPHYLTSRLGVLPEESWATAVYIAPESLVDHLLPRCRELDPPAYVEASLDAAGRALQRLHPDPPGAGLRELADAVDPGGELPAAWASRPRSGDLYRDAIRDAMVLREARAHGHYQAAQELGLSPLQLLVLSALWKGQSQDAIAGIFRWSEAEIEAAAGSLRERGWAASGGGLTAAGAAAREGIEEATDSRGGQPLSRLPESRRDQIVASLAELASI